MRRLDILKELCEPGYEVLLCTTYSIDIPFFEKMILRHLMDKDCRFISLFVDVARLTDAIGKPGIRELGRSYTVKPMEGSSAFHPKVYVLLGKTKAKIIIGSSNLTPAGFLTNNEVGNIFLYDEKQKTFLYLIQQAIHMFIQLDLPEGVRKRIEQFSYLQEVISTQNDILFLTNKKQSLNDQLSNIIHHVDSIEIFTPYYDRSLAVIQKWNEAFQPQDIRVYLQNKTSTFPLMHPIASSLSLFEAKFQENRRYHGKVIRFQGEQEEVIVYGSANCSQQAFLMSYEDGGNMEAVVVEKGIKGQFQPFYEQAITLEPL